MHGHPAAQAEAGGTALSAQRVLWGDSTRAPAGAHSADISDLRQLAADYSANAAQLVRVTAALRHLASGLLITDAWGRIAFFNPALEAMLPSGALARAHGAAITDIFAFTDEFFQDTASKKCRVAQHLLLRPDQGLPASPGTALAVTRTPLMHGNGCHGYLYVFEAVPAKEESPGADTAVLTPSAPFSASGASTPLQTGRAAQKTGRRNQCRRRAVHSFGLCGAEPGNSAAQGNDQKSGGHIVHGADSERKRHGQGVTGPLPARPEQAGPCALHQAELRQSAGKPAGIGNFRL